MSRKSIIPIIISVGTIIFTLSFRESYGQDAFTSVENGVLTFSDRKKNRSYKRYTQGIEQNLNSSKYVFEDFEGKIYLYSRQHGMEPALIRAVIETESNFNPNARSRKGAIGLMQLMPETAKELNVDPWDPSENLEGGIRYLKQLQGQYEANLKLILAAYNAGSSNVEKYRGVPPFPETKNYVNIVLQRYHRYRKEMSLAGNYSFMKRDVKLEKTEKPSLSKELGKAIRKKPEAPKKGKENIPVITELINLYN